MVAAGDFFKNPKMLKYWFQEDSAPAAKRRKSTAATSKKETHPYIAVREGLEVESLLRFFLFQKQIKVEIWSNKNGEWYKAFKVRFIVVKFSYNSGFSWEFRRSRAISSHG